MIICIEGNIGSGKSELIASLEKHLAGESIDFFPEPLDEWGETLQLYMKNKRKWAALFALDVLRGFGKVALSKARHQIVERSPRACRHVFCELDRNAGNISKDELPIIDQYFDLFNFQTNLTIHMDVNDAVCCDRIEMRGRAGEESLTYDMVRAISFQYDRMYKQFNEHPVVRCVQSNNETKEAFHARISYLILRAIQDHDKKHRLQDNE